jgi:hypothetical protein
MQRKRGASVRFQWLLAFSLIAAATARAESPTCDVPDLIGQCEMFNSPAGHFETRDQSVVLGNPTRAPGELAELQESWGRAGLRSLSSASSPSGVGESLRRWILSESSASTLKSLRGIEEKKDARQITFELPWPPDDDAAPMSRIPASEILGRLRSLLGPQNFDALTLSAEEHSVRSSQVEVSRQRSMEDLMTERANARRSRSEELIERTRQATIETIRNGRNWADLSDAEKNILRRLETLAVDTRNNINCGSILNPGGSYDGSTHQVNMCSATAALPDEAIMLIMAHEMAHSIDPCSSRGPLVRVDTGRLRSRADRAKNQQSSGETMLINSLAQSNGLAQIYPPDLNTPMVQQLMREGILRIEQPALRPGEHPFRGTLECLTQPNTGGFRLGPWQQAMQGQNHHRCAPDTLNEGFCDWLASEVLGRELRNRPARPRAADNLQPWRAEATRVFPLFARNLCFPDPTDPTPENVARLSPEEWEGRSHPPARLRVESVIFRNPLLREHFGCRQAAAPEPPHCPFPLPAANSPGQTDTPPTTRERTVQ